MAAFSQPPTDVKVNSYADLDEANILMGNRLYTTAWTSASESPSARGYVVDDGGGGLTPGETSIPIKDGVGDWTDGNRITFGNPGTGVQVYTVVGAFASGVSPITITPGLVSVPADEVPIYRFTPSEKESALIWSTCVLDYQMNWFGSQRFASRNTDVTSTPQQNLRWPRAGAIDFAGYPFIQTEYPEILVQVTAETALYLLQRDLAATPELLGLGFKKAEIPGPIKVEVDALQRVAMIPDYLFNKMREIGEPDSSATPDGMKFLRMARA